MKTIGFTLIELMIVTAIIAILMTIATQAYENYIIRAQVTEGFDIANSLQIADNEYFLTYGSFAPEIAFFVNANSLSTISGKYVSGAEIASGAIIITFGNQASASISNTTLAITPYVMNNSPKELVWVCGYAPTPEDAALGAGGKAAVTTVPLKYLPQVCYP